jgi:hypothetical protein
LLNVRDQVSNPYKTTGSFLLDFVFRGDTGRKKTLNRTVSKFPEINLILISSWMQYDEASWMKSVHGGYTKLFNAYEIPNFFSDYNDYYLLSGVPEFV